MENIRQFKELMQRGTKELISVQTHWAMVASVDWENKQMTATGLTDGLDFFETQLGLGSVYKKPVVGSKCLIGLINNNPASSFLLEAAEVETIEIIDKSGFKWALNDGQLTINGENFGGIVKAPELKTQVDKNTAILQAIQNAFSSWTPVSQDGGAALKAQVASIPSMQRADLADIENESIKHGG